MMLTGYKEIDEEHESITKIAKKLQKTIKSGDTDTILSLLKEFETEVREHFVSEEQVMRENNYPYLDAHQKLHNNYLEVFNHVISSYKESKSSTWLKDEFTKACQVMAKHIMNYDIPAFRKMFPDRKLTIS